MRIFKVYLIIIKKLLFLNSKKFFREGIYKMNYFVTQLNQKNN